MVKTRAAAVKPLKPMNPRTPDVKYTGSEPEWLAQPTSEARKTALMGAFNWYHYHYGKRDAREILVDWLYWRDDSVRARELGGASDHASMLTVGWLARMHRRGLELQDSEINHILSVVEQHCEAARSVKKVVEHAVAEVQKPNIQDRLRDIMLSAAADLEHQYDDLMGDSVKLTASYKPMAVLRGHNVAPPLVRDIKDIWQARDAELTAVIAGADAQLVEGYNNFTRTQLKTLLKFVHLVLADCDSYVQIKKTERAPRKKKPVSPERLTQRFPYLKEFLELKLKSEPVTKLVNANEAWLYDTKKRKLIHVMADSHVGSFTVKGTAIIGFDAVTTTQKTLRRPEEQLKLVQTAAAAARKAYKDIKATEVRWSGRGNENLILLRIR